MVKYFVFLPLLIGSMLPGFGQNKCNDAYLHLHPTESPSDIVKVALFIYENLQYPESAKRDSIVGAVMVRFWVDTAGYTSEHIVVKGIRKDLDEEALRVARLVKFDKPATFNGKPVGDCIWFPIRFPPDEGKTKPRRFWKFFKNE